MKIVIYDPTPPNNDYLSNTWFESLYSYGINTGRDISFVRNNVDHITNSSVFISANSFASVYPVKDNHVVSILKNNNNKIYCFDINDHSSLGFYGFDINAIDFIFKIAGIQIKDTSNEFYIDNDLTYRLEPKFFYPLGSIEYNNYKNFRETNRFMSLPYVMTEKDNADKYIQPYENRIKKCLVRGGSHFKRIHLFLNLLKSNLADDNSAFHIKPYSHMLCGECANIVKNQKYTYNMYKNRSFNCNNPVKWQEALPENFFNVNRWAWNNRCHPMYYWLLDRFMEKYGNLNINTVETVFNNPHLNPIDLNHYIGKYLFYGDFKWIFSIYMPQRFWAAARCKSINLLPERTADQSYFPELKKDDHFITFKEDFSDLDNLNNITKSQYEHITNNCYTLYNKYLKHNNYKVSENLMDEMFNKVN